MAVYEGRTGNARVLRSTASAVQLQLYKDGTLTAATGTPTVVVARADGTVVTGAAATTPSTGVYERTLTTTDTATLDILTATWTATVDASVMTFVTTHEVIGDELFTEDELRRFGDRAIADTTAFTDAAIAEARDRVTDEFERICEVSFVPRYTRETLDGDGSTMLRLPHGRVTAVRAASIDGTAVTTLADIVIRYGHWLYRPDGWTLGRQNVVVAYERGRASCPGEVKRAAMTVARMELVASDLSDRTLSYSNEMGVFRLSVPGPGRPTGIPIVDEILRRYDETPVIA
jgi:hypothetical protein